MIKKILTALFLVFMSFAVAATSPTYMLEKMSKNLSQSLRKNNSQSVRKIVERVVLPLVDKSKMSKDVVGRKYWLGASSAQKSKFITLFTLNVIKTYAGAIENYHKNRVVFYPVKKEYLNQKIINIKSSIESEDSPKINVIYILIKKNNSWRIIDFSVDGVSLVNSYRAQFRAILSEGGLSLLNKKLSAKLSN